MADLTISIDQVVGRYQKRISELTHQVIMLEAANELLSEQAGVAPSEQPDPFLEPEVLKPEVV